MSKDLIGSRFFLYNTGPIVRVLGTGTISRRCQWATPVRRKGQSSCLHCLGIQDQWSWTTQRSCAKCSRDGNWGKSASGVSVFRWNGEQTRPGWAIRDKWKCWRFPWGLRPYRFLMRWFRMDSSLFKFLSWWGALQVLRRLGESILRCMRHLLHLMSKPCGWLFFF